MSKQSITLVFFLLEILSETHHNYACSASIHARPAGTQISNNHNLAETNSDISDLSRLLYATRIDEITPGIDVRQMIVRILKSKKIEFSTNIWSTSIGDESGSIDLVGSAKLQPFIKKGAFVCIDGHCRTHGGTLRLVASSLRPATAEEAEKLTGTENGWASAVGPHHPIGLD